MSLRDDLDQLIRRQMMAPPVAAESMLTADTVHAESVETALEALSTYCHALREAVLELADQIDSLSLG